MPCAGADGTWPAPRRDPAGRAEAEAMVACAGKEALAGARRRRAGPVAPCAAVSGPEALRGRGAARVGPVHGLSAPGRARLGADGEGRGEGGAACFPESSEVVGHPGPKGKVAEPAPYIADNASVVGVPGPSLGTTGGDNATDCKKRLGGQRPRSREGLSAAASLLSARASRMAPSGRRPARETPRRRRAAAAMGARASLPAGKAARPVGGGYEPPSGRLARTAFDDREFADWVVNGTVR